MSGFDIEAFQEKLRLFAKERDWEQFHTPKNLAMALSVEASELLEIFQWLTPDESLNVMEKSRTAVEDELSDIVVYCLRLADILKVDLPGAMQRKMEKNGAKYPAHLARGSAEKYTAYDGANHKVKSTDPGKK